MRESIIDKRRNENWEIAFWCTPNSVIVQIWTPTDDGDRCTDDGPVVDVALVDFPSAVSFARSVCRRTKRAVDAASALVFNWRKTTPETFIALVNSCSQQRR